MARLLIHVEGQTEEGFVNEVLRNHLVLKGYHSVEARIVGNARLRERRGGIRPWPSVKKDICNHLQEDRACFATTMVDFYALPSAWPGRAQSTNRLTTEEKAGCVQDAMRDDLVGEMGSGFNFVRFVPFVVMHEFEGLLFSDCAAFSHAISRPDLEGALRNIRNEFETPEEIDDSPITAPSKRLQALEPRYQKPLLGVLAVLEIGLTRILEECPHFRAWLNRLETLLE
jgi:Domain of unknown function (DUF4276)